MTSGFSIILAVMLIIAGIGLLKKRESGRVMSIRYAWASIGTKVITLVMILTFMMPATTRYNEAMFSSIGSGMGSTMNVVTQISQLVGLAMTLIYPIVVLIMMRKEKVKTFLAAQPR
jgi:Ca2+/H+ antiporter